ncbi:helix-turn-helix transcriptional regulator [Cryptosporangium aurantiacum]|uniref:Regulatory protein, luxR family n=1 Tax=Cryptosporangium aurantiacum TaxID=134849 RepID=A0A1M7Q801_9ACTN|nr:helix-turn-helix transcriptional regulator [Cryptosporangium aurantiacum]SHN26615.1 regulatory protein, luxR family [Cryptosporangium aurantiacum]
MTTLIDRQTERARLDRMVTAVRGGESHVLVLHGPAGVGKSALLQYAQREAADLRVLRAVGIESEMELAFAGVHLLCQPLLDRLEHLPDHRREALETVFGMRAGAPPDLFLVSLAALDLLSSASENGPLLCLIDDAQWLDRASVQVFGYVGRRLLAESIGLLFGTREPGPELRGLEQMEITGLRPTDAHALLDSVTQASLDRGIRDRIVAESQGNPLALIELSYGLSRTQLAGGRGLLNAETPPGRIEESLLSRVEALSESARMLLVVAAAEPVGDPDLVLRAAERLGVSSAAGEVDELLTITDRVTFRLPLVRSAVYRAAAAEKRRAAHRVLAEVTDAETAPDRRAWHLAAASAEPDEALAAELERSAELAQARSGLAAAAAFLHRSVALTGEPSRRTNRMLAAADASLGAGHLDDARRILGSLDTATLDSAQSGRAGLLKGRVAFAAGAPATAIPLLLNAAEQLASTHPELAREACLHAWGTADVAGDRDSIVAVGRAARSLPATDSGTAMDLLLDGVALLVTEGRAAAAATLQEAAKAVARMATADVIRWGWLAQGATPAIWDIEGMRNVCTRQVRLVRDAGALQMLPYHLTALGYALTWVGDFAEAAAIMAESETVAAATRSPIPPYTRLHLLSLRGEEAETQELMKTALTNAAATGFGSAVTAAHWAGAILHNGHTRYTDAMRSALAAEERWNPFGSTWVLPELVEAASRADEIEVARDALERLVETTKPFDTDYARGLEARNRALVADETTAAELYREAVERLSRTQMRPDLARAHLLYGEWLRRRRQRVEAREQLRTAYEMFTSIGMNAFAERARRELIACGEKVRRRTIEATPGKELTEQERQIARFVRDGFTNPEIGERLFLSPRTIEWHLRNIFTKMGVNSRRQLRDVFTE